MGTMNHLAHELFNKFESSMILLIKSLILGEQISPGGQVNTIGVKEKGRSGNLRAKW